ncbi:hypothetical protein E4T38_03657 [Aureobasidium subglaciale]|nr:hypothetical protein E4T38_03657 [Aureobasidium subglaciale]KAI5225015.1 hypothetical protein E4T41_05405 [Aureobasidium subglaciale]KAI5225343.1 hypothetical protein E4T40_03432 [Aureobasidium subglaciale]KAI5261136.1 hypothetical protein E4T46_05298 [Aureobasidium subglaciale]
MAIYKRLLPDGGEVNKGNKNLDAPSNDSNNNNLDSNNTLDKDSTKLSDEDSPSSLANSSEGLPIKALKETFYNLRGRRSYDVRPSIKRRRSSSYDNNYNASSSRTVL